MKTQYSAVKSPIPENAHRVIERTSEDQLLLQGETTQGVVSAFHFRGGMPQTGLHGFHWEIHGESGSIVLQGAMGNAGAFAPDILLNGKKLDLPEGELSNVGREYLNFALSQGVLDFEYGILRQRMVKAIYESAQSGTRVSYI